MALIPCNNFSKLNVNNDENKNRIGVPISSVGVLGRGRGRRPGSGSTKNQQIKEIATGDIGSKMTVRNHGDSHCIQNSVSDHLLSGSTNRDQRKAPCTSNSKKVCARPGSGRTSDKHSAQEDVNSDIKFIDVPSSSRSSTCQNDGRDDRKIKSISPEDIVSFI